jgi:hypothetical protein
MKKLLYASLALALLMGVGCAIGDYHVITDTNTGEPINTSGKARLLPYAEIALGNGSNWQYTHWMMDQAASGAGTLTNYVRVWDYGDTDMWFGSWYCSPDWNGCSFLTAPNSADGNPYPYTLNYNCADFSRIYYLMSYVAYNYRYGECGNASLQANNIMNALDVVDGNTMRGVINRNTTNVYLSSNGFSSAINIYGSYPFTVDLGKQTVSIDASSPLYGAQRRVMDNWKNNFQNGTTTADIFFQGVQIKRQFAVL